MTNFSLAYLLTGNLLYGVLGLALAWLLVLLIHDIPQALPLFKGQVTRVPMLCKSDVDTRNRLFRLVCLALPLGVATTLVALHTNMPRYFIEYYLGEESLGVFASMAYLIVVGGMVINSFWQASSPRLANYVSEGDIPQFTQLLMKLVFIAFLLGGGGILVSVLWGEKLLVLLYGDEFSKDSGLFVLVMSGAAISYISAYLGSALMPLRLFRHHLILMVLVVLVNALACFFLVPRYGLVGAVFGWGSALIVYVFLSLFVVMRAVHLRRAD